MSEQQPEHMVLGSHLKPVSMEFEMREVDPAILAILTGHPAGAQRPAPTFSVEVHYPIKRTLWQWLRRKPKRWGYVLIPNAKVEKA